MNHLSMKTRLALGVKPQREYANVRSADIVPAPNRLLQPRSGPSSDEVWPVTRPGADANVPRRGWA